MASNYVLLRRIELSGSAASVDFTSIPQSGYTDLKIVVSGRINVAAVDAHMYLTFNNNASNAYSFKFLRGTGAAASSYSETNETSLNLYATVDGNSATSNTFSNTEIYIPNYTGSNYKALSVDAVQENNATTAYQHFYAGIWSNTAAITSVKLTGSASWMQYSTFSLYGLAAVGSNPEISPYASGGSSVTTDGTYWYHTFLSSGTFRPSKSLSCDYLVVAGGGGGGSGLAGGGAGGGFRTSSAVSFASSISHTIAVGAGGAAGPTLQSVGYSGGSSSISGSGFTTFSSSGGGGGGGIDQNGASGGSGGGGGGSQGGDRPGGAGNTGSYSPVEGYAGGKGVNGGSPYHMGGGGGGASIAGTDATTRAGGAGGNGAANSYSGSSVTYAGGGGGAGRKANSAPGGAGGSGGGGGGAGSNLTNATAGTANLGGGGGGGDWQEGSSNYFGAAGGSGIVIIRYAI